MESFNYKPYRRRAQYYETDQMGVIHHANYIRWLEEARIDCLAQCGISYAALEKAGVFSPIAAVSCQYKGVVRFDDEVDIAVSVKKYNGGIKLVLAYRITNAATGALCTLAETTSYFVDREGKFLSLKKSFPDLHAKISQLPVEPS